MPKRPHCRPIDDTSSSSTPTEARPSISKKIKISPSPDSSSSTALEHHAEDGIADINKGKERVRSRAKNKGSRRKADEDRLLTCPFYQYDPTRFRDCNNWKKAKLTTLVRHHLEKHQKDDEALAKDHPHRLGRKLFHQLLNWRKTTRMEQKQAEKLWKEMYAIIARIEGGVHVHNIPDPYYTEEDFSVRGIEEVIRRNVLKDPSYRDLMGQKLAEIVQKNSQFTRIQHEISAEFGKRIRELKAQRDEALTQASTRHDQEITRLKNDLQQQCLTDSVDGDPTHNLNIAGPSGTAGFAYPGDPINFLSSSDHNDLQGIEPMAGQVDRTFGGNTVDGHESWDDLDLEPSYLV